MLSPIGAKIKKEKDGNERTLTIIGAECYFIAASSSAGLAASPLGGGECGGVTATSKPIMVTSIQRTLMRGKRGWFRSRSAIKNHGVIGGGTADVACVDTQVNLYNRELRLEMKHKMSSRVLEVMNLDSS
jgi:hypothetical protein